jgi:large subunit ribosomal protein L18
MQQKIRSERVLSREKRRGRIRKKVTGSVERPRMSVFRSLKHIYVQIIDDRAGQTLVSVSSLHEGVRAEGEKLKKREVAKRVGEIAAKKCLEKGISAVVFDRGGYPYHGRVEQVATGAREGGLNF